MTATRFLLYRLTHSADSRGAPLPLGDYASYPAALAARDRDVLACLEAAGGRRIELMHALFSCPENGPWGLQRLACAVGQPVGWPVDLQRELAETGRWLARRAHVG